MYVWHVLKEVYMCLCASMYVLFVYMRLLHAVVSAFKSALPVQLARQATVSKPCMCGGGTTNLVRAQTGHCIKKPCVFGGGTTNYLVRAQAGWLY